MPRFGIPRTSAREQLQRVPPPSTAPVRPLPSGAPTHATLRQLGVADPTPLSFYVMGDSGGVSSPFPQQAVCAALREDALSASFIWHVGDLVYFGSDPDKWAAQFYEPNAHLPYPVLSNPGNHDDEYGGDPPFDPARGPLDQWMLNFCSTVAGIPPADPHNEFGRDTMTQPWCDWTLVASAMTLISLWSNVPSGGNLASQQTDWLAKELAIAPSDRPLLVSLHHPPYSIDAHHGGSKRMGAALDACFEKAQRCPDLVLGGHVHDYQRFTRSYFGREVAYIVVGNSGYPHLHALASGATPGAFMDAQNTVKFEYGDASEYGFLKLTIDGMKIAGEYVGVSTDGMGNPTVTPGKDAFTLTGAGAARPEYKAER